MLILDVGMITLNQYILLDPLLLFFMVGSVWGMIKVSKYTLLGSSYSSHWWFWLFITGTMLACTISVKFVGLFVVLLVGLNTIQQLWYILGDLKVSAVRYMKPINICVQLFIIILGRNFEATCMQRYGSDYMAHISIYIILLYSSASFKQKWQWGWLLQFGISVSPYRKFVV